MMDRVRQVVDRVLSITLVVIMAALVLDVLWQVFTRFVLRNPSSYTEELARYLMIWVGLLGAAYAAGKHMHLSVDLLRLEGRLQLAHTLVVYGFTVLFAIGALVVGGGRLVWTMLYLGQTSAALAIPLGYLYLAVPISGLLITFYAAYDISEALRARGR